VAAAENRLVESSARNRGGSYGLATAGGIGPRAFTKCSASNGVVPGGAISAARASMSAKGERRGGCIHGRGASLPVDMREATNLLAREDLRVLGAAW